MPRKLVHVTLAAPDRQNLAEDLVRLGFALDADGGGFVLGDGVRLDLVAGDKSAPVVGLSAEVGDAPLKVFGETGASFELMAPRAGAAPKHPNGAVGLRAVVALAEAPADHAEVLSGLTGQREMLATSAGLEIRLDGGVRLDVLTPPAFAFRLGVAPESSDGFRIAGLVFAVKNRTESEAVLRARGLEPRVQAGRLLAGVVEGVAVAFEQS